MGNVDNLRFVVGRIGKANYARLIVELIFELVWVLDEEVQISLASFSASMRPRANALI